MAKAICSKCKKMGDLSEVFPPICVGCNSYITLQDAKDYYEANKDLYDELLNDHHECGPSSLYRRQMCPGSLEAERGLPEVQSEYSEEGTLLHSAVWIEHDREQLSIDQLKTIGFVDDALEKIAAKYGVTEWHGETRVRLSGGRWGTIDCWGFAADGSIVIIDFKFGYKEVSSPASNLQLADYATGIMNEPSRTAKPAPQKVIACIIQPRIMGSNWSEFTFTKFDAITANIKDIIEKCNNHEAQRNAGEWCTYCKAFEKCNKVNQMKDALSEIEPSEITVANADEMYEKALLVEKKIKAIKAQCKQIAIDNGGRAGRLEIREKNGNRFIPDLQKAYESVQDIMTVQEFLSCCSAKISNLEKEVASRLKEQSKVKTLIEGKEKFNELTGVQNKKSTTEIKLNR